MNEYKELKETKNEYDKEAFKFLKETKSKLLIKNTGLNYPLWDEKQRHQSYKVCLVNEKGSFWFNWYGSINATNTGKKPTAYDILSGIGFCEVEDFNDFCEEFGYSNDSIKALNIYNEVIRQNKELNKMYTNEELELLNEVC